MRPMTRNDSYGCGGPIGSRWRLPAWSAVAAREEVLRASLEGLRRGHEKPEGIGQPTDRVEREADCERILDLRARDTGSQHRAHVVSIHRVLARQLAQHAQRRP